MSKPSSNKTTPAAAARVQSAVAIKNNGQVPKGSYATHIQSSAAKNSQPAGKTK